MKLFLIPLAASAVVLTAAVSGHQAAPPVLSHSASASAYWWLQGAADCLPMAARAIIGVETGNVISPAEIDNTATRVADYDADGSTWEKAPALLSVYGVSSHVVHTSLAKLSGHLPAMALVNAETIWEATAVGHVTGANYTEPNHVVVVEKIDAATVTVVDSSWVGGREAVLPVSVFKAAWATSDNAAIVVNH